MLNILTTVIPNTDDYYFINSEGQVFNRHKQLKTYINNSGYECIKLTKLSVNKHRLVHRLVAEAFLSNPLLKPEVNHKDGDKRNNSVTNLQWVTSSENKQHARLTGLSKYNEPSKGKKLGKHSKYHNVSYDCSKGKWLTCVRHDKKNHFQKRFNTEREAALHVNWILDTLGLQDRPRNVV